MIEPATAALVVLTYLVAGVVKGIVGLGLPTVTLAVLVPSLGLAPAVALTFVPTLVTNFRQALAGGHLPAILRRLWPLVLPAVLGCFLGTRVLATADADVLVAVLGVLLVVYSVLGLTAPPLPRPGRLEPVLGPVVGLLAGLMAGAVGSFTVPGVIYLHALRMPADMLVQTLGLVFLLLSVTLGAGLVAHALLDREMLALSATAVVPAMAGMELGQRLRRRLSERRFRTVFLVALLALGLNMAANALR